MFKAAILLSQDYNITIGGQFIGWELVNSDGDVMNTLSSTCLLVSTSNIVGIIGPVFSRESRIIAPFAAKLNIPVISYASTDPALSDRKANPTFYRTISSDNSAALAVAKLFITFNWKSCIIIYQNDVYGFGGAKALSQTFDQNNLTITDSIVFDIATLNIRGDLNNHLTSSLTRIIILWADQTYAPLILQKALESDVLGPQFTWILSANVPLASFDQSWHSKLVGILTVEPVVGNIIDAPINRTLLNAAYDIWQKYEPESFPGADNVSNYALFAFDATWLLIQSFQQLCSSTTNQSSSCISIINSSFCFDRHLLNSNSLFDIINSNKFLGVSGPIEFSINVTDRINGSYYVVKNVQNFSDVLNYIPVYEYSDSKDWTLYSKTSRIVWPGMSPTTPTGYAAISGVTLRIAIIEAAPFTMITEIKDKFGNVTKKYIGYVPDLIDQLQQLMKFIPNITWLPSNQTYNGLIDAVADDVYDMVIGDVTILAARRERVAFSSSIFENSLRVIIRYASADTVDFLAYLRPFSFQLWLIILCAMIWSVILVYIFERDNDALKLKSIISRIGMSIWYSIGTLVGYGADFHVKTAAGRLLTIGLYLISLVLIAAYTANLTSDLTIIKSQGIISGIDDIKNGRISSGRIGILTDSSIEEFYLREISGGSRNFYPLKSKEEMYSKLLNNIIDASVMDAGVLEYITGSVYCNLTLVGTAFDHSAFGIVYQKNWIYEQILDVSILSLRESGVFDELKNKWFQTSYCSQSSDTTNNMSMESMAGLFLTFGIITILSLLLFAWLKRSIIKCYLSKIFHLVVSSVNYLIRFLSRRSISKPFPFI